MKSNEEKKTSESKLAEVFVLSLGQLINSQISKSVEAFSKALNWSSIYTIYAQARSKSIIDNYKNGNITEFKDFYNQMCQKSGIEIKIDKFKEAWSAMIQIDARQEASLKKLAELQKSDKNFNLVIVSETNPEHFEHITKKLETFGLDLSKIHFTNSFTEKSLSYSELAKKALNSFDSENYRVITLHRDLATKEKLGVKNASVEYIPYNSNNSKFALHEIISAKMDNDLTKLSHVQQEMQRRTCRVSNPALVGMFVGGVAISLGLYNAFSSKSQGIA